MTAAAFLREHGGAAGESFVEKRNRKSTERRRALAPIYNGRGVVLRSRGLTAPHDHGNCSGKKGNCHTHDGHTNQTVTSGTN